MIDGKGLVYLKQSQTGAAGYDNPFLKSGATQLDIAAKDFKDKAQIALYKDAKKKEADLKSLEVDLEGWDYDNKRYFAEKENELKRKGAAILGLGKDINNYADKEVADWHKEVDANLKAAKASANQGEMYKSLVDLVGKDPDKYDVEATMAGAKKYMEMTPEERLKLDPQTLLVRRYDPYGPIENLEVDRFGGSDAWRGLTSESKVERLSRKKLKNEIKSRVENPENLKFYEYNKDKLGFKSLEDYANYLYTYKENQWVADYQGGLIPQAKAGEGNLVIDRNSVLGDSTPYARVNSTRGFDTVQLGTLGAVVSGNDAYKADKYTPLGNKTREVKSGAMVNVVVNKAGQVLSIPFEPSNPNRIQEYEIYNNATNKMDKFTGTYDKIASELVRGNYGSFKPMVYGLIEVPGTKLQQAYWVNPNAILNGVNGEKYKVAFDELERRAQEKNNTLAPIGSGVSEPSSSSSGALDYTSWKLQNPNGTAADYVQYKNKFK